MSILASFSNTLSFESQALTAIVSFQYSVNVLRSVRCSAADCRRRTARVASVSSGVGWRIGWMSIAADHHRTCRSQNGATYVEEQLGHADGWAVNLVWRWLSTHNLKFIRSTISSGVKWPYLRASADRAAAALTTNRSSSRLLAAKLCCTW